MTVEPRPFTSYVKIIAEAEAMNDVTVSAEESGTLERFYVEKGSAVTVGKPIAKIDDRLLRAQVEEARAAAELAAWRYERQKELWQEQGIGSELNFQEAKSNAALQAARLENLEARLDRTVIRSPISGVFDQRFVDAGERVDPATPVARVVEVERLKITGGVPERYAAAVQPGDDAKITFDVLPGHTFEDAIEYVGRTVDTRNRTFPIEIVIENPDQLIKPNMVANVEIAVDRLESVLVVPQNAVLRTESGYQTFVIEEEDGELFARARGVEVGPTYENETVIRNGLEPGDRVVVRGQQLVEAGDRVAVVGSGATEGDR